ncbi:hypothetical protein BH20ACI2_BH20ACI2_27290 [soil metagenome]
MLITAVIGFGLIQLTTPVVRANGCPSDPGIGCMCNLIDAVSVESGGNTIWYCTYGCYCPGGGGEGHMYIERTFEYPE